MIKTYMVLCNYLSNVDSIKADIERRGGHFCGYMEVPYYNRLGQPIGTQYVVIYQHIEELLDFEIVT